VSLKFLITDIQANAVGIRQNIAFSRVEGLQEIDFYVLSCSDENNIMNTVELQLSELNHPNRFLEKKKMKNVQK